MKKNLNTAELESQLAGSVFFRKAKPVDLQAIQQTSTEENHQNSKAINKKAVQFSPLSTPLSKKTDPAIKENKRTDTPNERTDKPLGSSDRLSLLNELEEGVREVKRGTERYSFEIFTDQKGSIEDLQYRYK